MLPHLIVVCLLVIHTQHAVGDVEPRPASDDNRQDVCTSVPEVKDKIDGIDVGLAEMRYGLELITSSQADLKAKLNTLLQFNNDSVDREPVVHENIALNKLARQSSHYVNPYRDSIVYGLYRQAFLAVDGFVHNGNITIGDYCTHTENNMNAWWKVDLGKNYKVTGLKIYGRRTQIPRLRSFYVGVSDAEFPDDPRPGAYPVCFYHNRANVVTVRRECRVPRIGRYVIIQLDRPDYLELCEVQITAEEV